MPSPLREIWGWQDKLFCSHGTGYKNCSVSADERTQDHVSLSITFSADSLYESAFIAAPPKIQRSMLEPTPSKPVSTVKAVTFR